MRGRDERCPRPRSSAKAGGDNQTLSVDRNCLRPRLGEQQLSVSQWITWILDPHLVAYLCDGSSDVAIEAAAQRAGIVVRAISRFYRAARPRRGLMLGSAGFRGS